MKPFATALLTAFLMIGAPAAGAETAPRAPLFDDLGKNHWPISSKNPKVQRYFDQGLILTYAFNHAEAERSFQEAARLDPECAICVWGTSLVLGPNINAPMDPKVAPEAYERAQKALSLASHASEKERALIEALSKRYAREAPADRAPLDLAYADAMRQVARRYPDDVEVQALFAEALMDLTPWAYWDKEGKETKYTAELLRTIESVLAKNPDHPGAIHFYIHTTEASRDPGRAAKYADKLGTLTPGAGHLVHMPAHTYMRIGRYHDAVLVNQKAAAADDSYMTQCRRQGMYPLAYVPHNHHFLWAAAAMEGASKVALAAAVQTDEKTMHEHVRAPGLGTALQHFTVTPMYALVRFARWDDILALEKPAEDLVYPSALWHWARGHAYAGRDELGKAREELAALEAILARPELAEMKMLSTNPVSTVLGIATDLLAAEIARKDGRLDQAIARLQHGVELEDSLLYTEPSDWPSPVRHHLGAVLLEAGRASEAEAVYRADLDALRNPDNGWALFGLRQSLEAQGKNEEARQVQARFERAWVHADVELESSRATRELKPRSAPVAAASTAGATAAARP
ncbi:MAG TPA: hypothetical protein VEC57_19240 [Candidatus Limnocylindrales bacterium]|nr:hypothetical protein [Candidatus Limnocylindrales bacterium]